MSATELKRAIGAKIAEGDFGPKDIPDYLVVFCETCERSDDALEEVQDWNRRVVFDLAGLGPHWLQVEGGRFATGPGTLEAPDLTLSMPASDAADVFSGDKDAKAAYMAGTLQVQGELPDAIKIQTLVEIVCEELE